MDTSVIHIIEFTGIFLGGGAALLKFWPEFKQATIFFQVAFLLTQIFGFYIKNNPAKKKKLQEFVSDVLKHYLKTHPYGKVIAASTDIDEKVQKFIDKENKPEIDRFKEFYSFLGMKVDTKQDSVI